MLVGSVTSERVTTERTLHVPETPDTTDTVADAYKTMLGGLYAIKGTEGLT